MTNKYHKKIEEYMLNQPRCFIKMSKVQKALKITNKSYDMYNRAIQDLICNGRLEMYPDGSIRITQ